MDPRSQKTYRQEPSTQMSTRETPVIFLSCGQYRDEEKALGQQVKELLERNRCVEVYFAENQTTFEAFTKNILSALNRCVGFIGVMHHRGEVHTPTGSITRASVWIEQEIAIAAFIQQILNRSIEVQLYIQDGIAREGMRDKLLLNAHTFRENSEVLEHLAGTIDRWKRLNRAISVVDPLQEASYKQQFDQTKSSFYIRTRSAENGQEIRSGTYFLMNLSPASFPSFNIDLSVRNAFIEDIFQTFPRHKNLAVDQSSGIATEVSFDGAREFILRVAGHDYERRWSFTQDGIVRFITQSVWPVSGTQNHLWSAYDVATDVLSFLALVTRFWNKYNYRWPGRLNIELKIEKAQLYSDKTGYPTLFHQLTTSLPELFHLDSSSLVQPSNTRGFSSVFEDVNYDELNGGILEFGAKVAGEVFNGLAYEVDLERLHKFMRSLELAKPATP
jgi:hypothetical protein